MCEGHRSTGWTFDLWESAIYLEDISPNHPNKTKQPNYHPTPHPNTHNCSLGRGCTARWIVRDRGGQCCRNSGKVLYLLITFQMHQGLWTVSCPVPSAWRCWEPKEREQPGCTSLLVPGACLCLRLDFFRAKVNQWLKIRQEAEHGKHLRNLKEGWPFGGQLFHRAAVLDCHFFQTMFQVCFGKARFLKPL